MYAIAGWGWGIFYGERMSFWWSLCAYYLLAPRRELPQAVRGCIALLQRLSSARALPLLIQSSTISNLNAASEFICLKVKSRNKLLLKHLKITATTPSDSELCILCSVVFRAPKNLIQSITIFNLKAASEFSCLKVKSRKKYATIFN